MDDARDGAINLEERIVRALRGAASVALLEPGGPQSSEGDLPRDRADGTFGVELAIAVHEEIVAFLLGAEDGDGNFGGFNAQYYPDWKPGFLGRTINDDPVPSAAPLPVFVRPTEVRRTRLVSESLNALGALYQRKGGAEDARASYQDALDLLRSSLDGMSSGGADDAGMEGDLSLERKDLQHALAGTLRNLASLCRAQGDLEGETAALKEVLQARLSEEEVAQFADGGWGSPVFTISGSREGQTLRSEEGRRNSRGVEAAAILNDLSELRCRAGDWAAAAELNQKAMGACQAVMRATSRESPITSKYDKGQVTQICNHLTGLLQNQRFIRTQSNTDATEGKTRTSTKLQTDGNRGSSPKSLKDNMNYGESVVPVSSPRSDAGGSDQFSSEGGAGTINSNNTRLESLPSSPKKRPTSDPGVTGIPERTRMNLDNPEKTRAKNDAGASVLTNTSKRSKEQTKAISGDVSIIRKHDPQSEVQRKSKRTTSSSLSPSTTSASKGTAVNDTALAQGKKEDNLAHEQQRPFLLEPSLDDNVSLSGGSGEERERNSDKHRPHYSNVYNNEEVQSADKKYGTVLKNGSRLDEGETPPPVQTEEHSRNRTTERQKYKPKAEKKKSTLPREPPAQSEQVHAQELLVEEKSNIALPNTNQHEEKYQDEAVENNAEVHNAMQYWDDSVSQITFPEGDLLSNSPYRVKAQHKKVDRREEKGWFASSSLRSNIVSAMDALVEVTDDFLLINESGSGSPKDSSSSLKRSGTFHSGRQEPPLPPISEITIAQHQSKEGSETIEATTNTVEINETKTNKPTEIASHITKTTRNSGKRVEALPPTKEEEGKYNCQGVEVADLDGKGVDIHFELESFGTRAHQLEGDLQEEAETVGVEATVDFDDLLGQMNVVTLEDNGDAAKPFSEILRVEKSGSNETQEDADEVKENNHGDGEKTGHIAVAALAPDASEIRSLTERLRSQKETLGTGHPCVAETLTAISRVYQRRGDISKAIGLSRQALRIQRAASRQPGQGSAVLTNDAKDLRYQMAQTLYLLATLQENIGDLDSSISCLCEALALHQEACVGNHLVDEAMILNKLGKIHLKKGNHSASMEYHKRALANLKNRTKKVGDRKADYSQNELQQTLLLIGSVYYQVRNSPEKNESEEARKGEDICIGKKGDCLIEPSLLVDIATAHHNRGEYSSAVKFHEEVLELLRHQGGNRTWSLRDVAAALNRLGQALIKVGRYDDAKDCHSRALHMQKLLPDLSPSETASTKALIAVAEYHGGQYREALGLYEEAFHAQIDAYGDDHPILALTLYGIGIVKDELGENSAALSFLNEALKIQESTSSESTHQLKAAALATKMRIAKVTMSDGDNDAAMKTFERVLQQRRQWYGQNHPDVAEVLQQLGVCHARNGELSEAMKNYRECYIIRSNFLGKDHPDIAATLNSIGAIYAKNGRNEKALMIYDQALQIRRDSLRDDHVDIARSLGNQGVALAALGRYTEAMEKYREALQIREASLTNKHPSIGDLHVNIGNIHLRKCAFGEAAVRFEMALNIYRSKLREDHPKITATLAIISRVKRSEELCV